jgi:uncharacterized OsmC-like protein
VALPALSISDTDKAILESTGRRCPVARSLHPDVEQDIHFSWA